MKTPMSMEQVFYINTEVSSIDSFITINGVSGPLKTTQSTDKSDDAGLVWLNHTTSLNILQK